MRQARILNGEIAVRDEGAAARQRDDPNLPASSSALRARRWHISSSRLKGARAIRPFRRHSRVPRKEIYARYRDVIKYRGIDGDRRLSATGFSGHCFAMTARLVARNLYGLGY